MTIALSKIDLSLVKKNKNLVNYDGDTLKFLLNWVKVTDVIQDPENESWYIQFDLSKQNKRLLTDLSETCKSSSFPRFKLTTTGKDILFFDNYTKEPLVISDYHKELVGIKVKPLIRVIGFHKTTGELVFKVDQLLIKDQRELEFQSCSELEF
jgi:hypothetical protein